MMHTTIKYTEMSNVRHLVEEFNNGLDSGNFILVHSTNPHIEAKLEESVPFSLEVATIRGVDWVLVQPEYSGPGSFSSEDAKQEMIAGLIGWVLPVNDTYFEMHVGSGNTEVAVEMLLSGEGPLRSTFVVCPEHYLAFAKARTKVTRIDATTSACAVCMTKEVL